MSKTFKKIIKSSFYDGVRIYEHRIAKTQALGEDMKQKRGHDLKYHWTIIPMCSSTPKIILSTNYKVYK